MSRNVSLASLKRNPIGILFIIVILQASILSYLSIMKHHAFLTTAWDLGIYEQVIWSTLNTGRLFWYTVEIMVNPSCNFLGIHFSPFLLLVLPVYAISQTTETLLALQAFFLALGAVPLYKLVAYERGSYKQALVFASIYLAYPPLIGVGLFDFHVQAFLPFLFFSAFYYFRKEEWGKYFFFIVLSLMDMEFIPLIVIFFGFYGLWTSRRKVLMLLGISNFKRLLLTKTVLVSIITIILGLAWFIAALSLILRINPSAPPQPNWAASGDPVHNLSGFIFNVLTNPIKTLQIIFTSADQKALYIFGLLAPLAFLPCLDLPSLMIGAPWFFVVFLSNYPPYYSSVGYQYVAFVIPFIFISAVCGVKHLSQIKQHIISWKRFAMLLQKRFIAQHLRTLKISFLVFLIVMSLVITLTSYSRAISSVRSLPTVTEHDRIAEAFTELIPSNASILTQNDLFPHLSKRLYGYVAGELSQNLPENTAFDYILIDTTSTWYQEPLRNLVFNLTRDGVFGVQYAADGLWLLERNYTGKTIYPIKNGVFMNFYNQGVLMKIFNSTSFDGNPSYESLQQSISFNQGSNASQTWTTDNFSALEFEGWLYIPVSGNYSFRLEKAGASSLYLDGQKVLYCENPYLCLETLNHVEQLERGFHQIKIEYTPKKLLPPSIRLQWKPPWEINITDIPSAFIYPDILSEASSPFLNLNLNLGLRSPFPLVNEDYFSAFANCTLYTASQGKYEFKVTADGYAFLSIDGKIVSQAFNSTQNEFEFMLTEGHHVLEVDYMAVQGDAKLSVLWKTPTNNNFEEMALSNLDWQGD